MPVSEILIVYLAFGAPLAVYRYFESRSVSRRHRILVALMTFVFWVPFAVRLSIRHFSNASSEVDFVSPPDPKRSTAVTNSRQEAVGLAIAEAGCPLPRQNLRDRIEQYVGLSEALADRGSKVPGEKAVNFLRAAGHSTDLAAICLSRRERNRLHRHLIDSRKSFLALFDHLSGSKAARTRAIRRGVELALMLSDMDAADHLGALEFDLDSSISEEATTVTSQVPGISMGRTAATID